MPVAKVSTDLGKCKAPNKAKQCCEGLIHFPLLVMYLAQQPSHTVAAVSDSETQRAQADTAIPDLSGAGAHQVCAPSPSLQPPPFPFFPILLYCILGKGAGSQPLHLMCPIDSW